MCSSRRIKAVFGPQVRRNIHVKDPTGVAVLVPASCGVKLTTDKNHSLVFLSRYDSCFTRFKDRTVVIPLHVQLIGEDRWYRVNISCPLIKKDDRTPLLPTSLPGDCSTPKALRVDCGHQSISSEVCSNLGCCYDTRDQACYYRLNSCSLDGHFVFSVKTTDTEPPVDPSSLTVKDHPHCFPVITTADMAVFKIGIMDCGAKMKVDGDTVIYEVDVEGHHGESGKESSLSLQVACEYKPSELKKAADPRSRRTDLPPAVAVGSIDVRMRIARDASFTSFFAEDELPVTLPLREVAHVEISIVQPSPDPTLSLRVRDCFAYPATKHSVWTLLYDGCPNPLDDMGSSIPVDNRGKTAFHSQVRRFDVKTFAFLDPHTGHPSQEQVYFYCWVEICIENVECAQHCSISSSEVERHKRGALSTSDHIQLIFLGPLQLGQNNTDVEDNLCLRFKKMFQVYILCGAGTALLVVVLVIGWRSIRWCQKQQAQDAQRETEQSQ